MTEGWIALHRKIYNSNDFGNQLEVAVFLYLVAMASHKPVQVIYRKKKLTLKRGEVSIAYKDLAKKFDISERKVRGIIKNLVHTKNLNQTLHKNLSIYTIVKYSKYQDVPVKTDQTLTDRTTTIYTNTTSIDKNKISLSSMTDKPKKIQIPLLQSLKSAIIEKPREKNEFEIMKERLDAEDYEKWVLRQLNS
jgi:predicted regulator of amino acid metabolism with ACT domain